MGLETASFISGLVATNPPGTDKKSQGDDHLRLVKAVLQGSFPTSSKAWYNPTTSAKGVNFSVLAADMNAVFVVSLPAADVTGTLPVLAAGDAGWECGFVSFSLTPFSFWVAPPSGNIFSGEVLVAKTRRVVPLVVTRALWTGSLWVMSRAVGVPVGSLVHLGGGSLPAGYELANGQTLAGVAGSVYPDYFARMASLVVPTLAGYAVVVE